MTLGKNIHWKKNPWKKHSLKKHPLGNMSLVKMFPGKTIPGKNIPRKKYPWTFFQGTFFSRDGFSEKCFSRSTYTGNTFGHIATFLVYLLDWACRISETLLWRTFWVCSPGNTRNSRISWAADTESASQSSPRLLDNSLALTYFKKFVHSGTRTRALRSGLWCHNHCAMRAC